MQLSALTIKSAKGALLAFLVWASAAAAQAPDAPKVSQNNPEALPAAATLRAPVTPSGILRACPIQVPPAMPREARVLGVSGVVTARATVKNGRVLDVEILSSPGLFDTAVKEAMFKYQCDVSNETTLAIQTFDFKIQDGVSKPAGKAMDFSAAATRLKTSREKFDLGQAAQTNAYAPEALRLYQESASDGYAPAQRQCLEVSIDAMLVPVNNNSSVNQRFSNET